MYGYIYYISRYVNIKIRKRKKQIYIYIWRDKQILLYIRKENFINQGTKWRKRSFNWKVYNNNNNSLFRQHRLTYGYKSRASLSQDVQTWFSVQLAFDKFLSKIKEIFLMQCQYHGYNTHSQISFILDRNLSKANCTENHVCKSCDKGVLGINIKHTRY